MNVFIQFLFPVATTFTPVVMASTSEISSYSSRQTEMIPYTLKDGETTQQIAQRYNMTLVELKTLNASRISAKEFDNLQAGDTINVPMRAGTYWSLTEQEKSNSAEKKLATGVMSAGTIMSSNNPKDSATSMAKSMASQEVNGSIQQWLSQFGTAQVQLDVDNNFNLANSELDFLLPLYDKPSSFLFTQFGMRHKDSRNTINIGLGGRYYTDNWMYGVNTFFDNDITGNNKRIGFGAESWSNYLKFSANSYLSLTDWHKSNDFVDYNERPANGYDLRAEAYLPAYPQLGGKLMYEHYFGDEVGLFGKDNLQKNPYAFTIGLAYTPIPLLNFSLDHRQGKEGNSDTNVNMQLTYRLGVPWGLQIDPEQVSVSRKLAGSRYDLVERNNNIVLQYQKQTLIHLKMAEVISGYGGEEKSLGMTANAKYGVDTIEWDAAALIANGGEIVDNGGHQYTVVLPKYQAGSKNTLNTYTISAVAIDVKGNRSSRESTTINLIEDPISAQNSRFTTETSTINANGQSQAELILLIKDNSDQFIDVAVDEINIGVSSSANRGATAQVGQLTKESTGKFSLIVTAGTVEETIVLTPTVRGVTLSPATITITKLEVDEALSSFQVSPESIVADGNESATLIFSAVNEEGVGIGGLNNISFIVKGVGDTTQSVVTETEVGVYSASLSGSQAGTATIIPAIDGVEMTSLGKKLTLNVGEVSADHSDFTLTETEIMANTKDSSDITLTLKDANGNLIKKKKVSFTVKNVTDIKFGEVRENNGVYTTKLTAGVMSGTATITPQLEGTPIVDLNQTLILNEDMSAAHIDIKASAAKAKAEDGQITLTINAKTHSGKPAVNSKLTFTADNQATNRQGGSYYSHPKLLIDKSDIGTKEFVTDNKGQVIVQVTDPRGIGLKQKIYVRSEENRSVSSDVDVIFSVITSPDSPSAKMYGHMPEKYAVSHYTHFSRPQLASEVHASQYEKTYLENNETWPLFNGKPNGTAKSAATYCNERGLILPEINHYNDFFNQHRGKHGFPGNVVYWSGTKQHLSPKWHTKQILSGAQMSSPIEYHHYTVCKQK